MATTDDVATATQLAAHERIEQDRYEHIEHGLKKIKGAIGAEGTKMTEGINPLGFLPMLMGGNTGTSTGVSAAAGAAVGSMLFGGRRGGLFGGDDGGGVAGNFVTPTQLSSGLNGVADTINNNAVMQGVADIKQAVPVAEGQVQIALQNAQADLNRNIDSTGDQIVQQLTAAQLANAAGFAAASRETNGILATSLANQNLININVLQQGAATREAVALYGNAGVIATKDAATATALAVANSTKEILAALTEQNLANLQRQLTVTETALARRETESLVRGSEVNVTQTVNQVQSQAQLQAQAQQQTLMVAQLLAGMNSLQHATAANTSIIAGNSGNVRGLTQTATPTNVNT